jgi:hypothetical protein
MSTEPQRTCPSCGNELFGAIEFCPVCMLRKGLPDAAAEIAILTPRAFVDTPQFASPGQFAGVGVDIRGPY